MALPEPDDNCPGQWVELEPGVGYCSLGDQCRNPTPEAHQRRIGERETNERP